MEARYLMDATCTAKSKTTGNQCKNPRVPGATVCRIHGGSAPQVQAAAARRVLEGLVTPALMELRSLLLPKDDGSYAAPPHVRLTAIRDVLDRTGYKAPTQFEGVLTMDMVEREIARLEAELEE